MGSGPDSESLRVFTGLDWPIADAHSTRLNYDESGQAGVSYFRLCGSTAVEACAATWCLCGVSKVAD